MEIPINYQISDSRDNKYYKNITFSGYKKTHVYQALEKSLLESKLEDSCKWSIEIIISGYIEELWEKLLLFVCKNINIGNIEMISYFKQRYKYYISLIQYKNIKNFLELRNNQQFRNLICEIICMLSMSKKMKLDSLKKVKKSELSLDILKERMKAKTIINNHVIKVDDPEEIKIVSNEFLFCIRNNELQNTLYWLSWMIEWEKLNIKKLKVFKCAYRPQDNVDNKLSYDLLWLIWDIIIKETQNKKFRNEIESLFYLFKSNYKKTKKNKRLILVVYAIKLISYGGFKEPSLIERYDILIRVSTGINLLYKEKKRYEDSTEEGLKKLKFYNIHRDSLRTNENPYKKPKKKKPKKPKKPKNISDKSLEKLNTFMNVGIIRRDNYESERIIHYARPDPTDTIKYINIGKK